MARTTRRLAPVLLLGLILCLPVQGQGQVMPTQTGRQLDVNPQVGSGGYNDPAGGNPTGLNSQLYVTGQVTGLAGFRGRVPYAGVGLLDSRTPSAGQSGFIGRSVGVQDVLRGQTYLTNPYYSPSRTVLNAGGIMSGQAAPGTNMPKSAVPVSPLVNGLYTSATEAYQPLMTGQTGQAISLIVPPLRPDVGGSATYTTTQPSGEGYSLVSRPGAGALFGVMNAQDRVELAREMYETQMLLERRETKGLGQPGLLGGVGPKEKEKVSGLTGGLSDQGRAEQPGPPLVPGPEIGNNPLPKPNQDVYVDLLVHLYRQRSGGEPLIRPVPAPAAPSLTGAVKEANESAAVETSKERGIVLHALAGTNQDSFNRYMARAGTKLKAGHFYDAAGDYELALIVNPNNPLANVGLGLASFGAGEPLSAGLCLRTAMERFPPLMETTLDFSAMMDKSVVEHRVTALDERLAAKGEPPDPQLVFLATFMHRNLGHAEQAKAYAQQLQTVASGDKLLVAYANYILTGKRPTATTKPG